jgi:hypothetical protein
MCESENTNLVEVKRLKVGSFHKWKFLQNFPEHNRKTKQLETSWGLNGKQGKSKAKYCLQNLMI